MMIMVIMMMMVTMNDIVGGLHYEQSDPQPTLLCGDHTRPGHLSIPSYEEVNYEGDNQDDHSDHNGDNPDCDGLASCL